MGTAYREQDGSVRGLTPADFAILMRSTRTNDPDGLPRHTPFTRALDAAGVKYSLEAGGGAFDRLQVRAIRQTFELLRAGSPTRDAAQAHFDAVVLPVFPDADFLQFTRVLAEWGRQIHGPIQGPRRRVYPQQLVYDFLNAFRIERSAFDDEVMRDLGLFSRMIQDVEAVYLSIDSPGRFGELLNFLGNVAESGYDTSTDDLVMRPDAVTVATVHKMKGLEFPVVFVSDVENGRFPGNRRAYDGWLPNNVLQQALARGAYQSTADGEARLFYTALTRAERYLYVTGSTDLPGGRRHWVQSRFSLRLNHPELSADPHGLPAGLVAAQGRRRLEETDLPTSFSEIRYYLLCPKNYQFRKSYGFSPPIPEMFGFGKTVHTAVEKLHEVFTARAPTPQEAEALALELFHLKHVAPSRDPENNPGPYERAAHRAGEIVGTYAGTFAQDFARERQVETRFEVAVRGAVISGSIDLLLRQDAEGNILDASVIDFKAIEAGPDPEANPALDWTELALQVQLYAKAAREVLGENARTGHVHLLKDNQRVEVPVGDAAVAAAVGNVEWAVERILAGDFPMRPQQAKCEECDFKSVCARRAQQFQTDRIPPTIHIPGNPAGRLARALSEFEP